MIIHDVNLPLRSLSIQLLLIVVIPSPMCVAVRYRDSIAKVNTKVTVQQQSSYHIDKIKSTRILTLRILFFTNRFATQFL